MRKVWDAIFTVIALLIVIQLAIASVQPYLPLLGLSIVILLVGLVVRALYFRRKFW